MAHWIVPTNYAYFRLEDFLRDFKDIVWSHHSNFKVGDTIFIYATAPIKRLTYVMQVIRINISEEEADTKYNDRDYSYGIAQDNTEWNDKLSVFRLVTAIPENTRLSLDDLRRHGCKSSMQGSMKPKGELLDYILGELSALDSAESEFREIASRLREFNRERNWERFHDPKSLALSISVEAAELNECFLWKQPEEADPEKVKEELADVMLNAIMLADKYGFDIKTICLDKIERNAKKYPVSNR